MINCDFTTVIPDTQCVGDSLATINENFNNLTENLCNLFNLFPSGIILPYAGSTTPAGWLPCDGTYKSQTAFPDLYAAITNTYGPPVAGTFALPDARGRVIVGAGAGTGLTNRVIGNKFGVEKVILTTSQLPSHKHDIDDLGHTHTATQASHTHTLNDPKHAHGITDPQHQHNLYAGYAAGNDEPTSKIYGEALANGPTVLFNHLHSFGSWSSTASKMPGLFMLSDHTNGSQDGLTTRLTTSTTTGNMYVESLGGIALDTKLQVTNAKASTGISVVSASTGITVLPVAGVAPVITVAAKVTGIIITKSAGSDTSHDNTQPSIVMNYIIKI